MRSQEAIEADRKILGRWADYFDLTHEPGEDDDDNANWLKSLSWGGMPETGPEFMEATGLYDMTRAEQRYYIDGLVDSGRVAHMPAAVREHLEGLGLID